MLYYAVLLIFWLFVGFFALWLCKQALEITRRVLARKSLNSRFDPNYNFDGAITDTEINKSPQAWGKFDHQTPSMEARTHPAVPEKSTFWRGWPMDENEAHEGHPVFTDSNGSKTESEFWRCGADTDVQSHGTGISRE
jgi:hypothetical protein